jgi:integrase/recombinase XerD
MTSLRRRMIEDMQIRNLAVNTQKVYVQQVSQFAQYFQKSPERLGPEQIRAYQLYLTNKKKLSTGSITIAISALRFLFRVTLKKIGPLSSSSRPPRCLKNCSSSSAPRKSFSFLTASGARNIALS